MLKELMERGGREKGRVAGGMSVEGVDIEEHLTSPVYERGRGWGLGKLNENMVFSLSPLLFCIRS